MAAAEMSVGFRGTPRELAECPEASHSIVGLIMDGVLSVSIARAKFGAIARRRRHIAVSVQTTSVRHTRALCRRIPGDRGVFSSFPASPYSRRNSNRVRPVYTRYKRGNGRTSLGSLGLEDPDGLARAEEGADKVHIDDLLERV